MVQPVRSQGEWHWPETKEMAERDFGKLANMNMDAIKRKDVDRIVKLAKSWLNDQIANQPISSKPDTADEPFGCLIGHSKLSEARAAWEELKSQDRLWTPATSQPITGFSEEIRTKISAET
jgi:hypothetical protein